MGRPAAFLVLAIVIAAGCGLVEPPPPAGFQRLVIEVVNRSGAPARLAVTRPGDEDLVIGEVRPASVPPNVTAMVTFFLPPAQDWAIQANDVLLVDRSALDGRYGFRPDIHVEITPGGVSVPLGP